jgi:nucleotide-binding universal stress UspA family protein
MKILVCTDGSKAAAKTLERTARLVGESCQGEVTVLHVYEKKTPYRGVNVDYQHMTKQEYDSILQASRREGKRILAEAARFFQDQGITVKTILKGGHAAQTIAQTANEEGFDMIIIGSRGMSGLNRWFMGSVSNAVLHEAKTDVLVVK